ncbi:hypothetical protein DEF23_26805, partial [Marinitenerispora sediminis]
MSNSTDPSPDGAAAPDSGHSPAAAGGAGPRRSRAAGPRRGPADRLVGVDVARGLAVLGMFVVHVGA